MPWITPDGNYYPGAGPVAEGSIQVPERPGEDYSWIGDEWVFSPKVPRSVPIRNARKVLRAAGLLGQVEAAINALPGTAGDDARDDWEYSSTVERDNPTLLLLAQAIGLTDQEVDQLFIAANSLP